MKKRLLGGPAWLMIGVILWAGLLAAGCGTIRETVAPTPGPIDAAYQAALDRWAAGTEVYRDLELMLRLSAVYKSPAFRDAYVDKYAHDFQLSPDEADRMRAAEKDAADRAVEFLVALSGPTEEKNDLVTRDPAWRLFLELDAGERLEPFDVRPLKDTSLRIREFYPFISPWARVYTVRFMAPETLARAGRLNLVVTGVLGTARLSYNLED